MIKVLYLSCVALYNSFCLVFSFFFFSHIILLLHSYFLTPPPPTIVGAAEVVVSVVELPKVNQKLSNATKSQLYWSKNYGTIHLTLANFHDF